MPTALLLIAHGSRRTEANADLEFIAGEVRSRESFGHVQVSYLELAEPNIERGGELCVEQGADTVVMLPYFLSPGIHVVEDLVAARDQLSARFPNVTFRLAEPLGRHPKLVEIVLERASSETGTILKIDRI
jgi:sirohydrochlorin ferrochelatase